jgi:hypothetical protein
MAMNKSLFTMRGMTVGGVARTGLLLVAGTAAALPVGCASSGQINESADLTRKAVRGDYDQALIMAGDNADLKRQVHERYVPIMTAISNARIAALNNDVDLAKQQAQKLIEAIDFMGDQATETLKLLREIVKKRLENGTLGNLWDFLSGKDPLKMTPEELRALEKRIAEAESKTKPKTQGGTKQASTKLTQQQATDAQQAARGPAGSKGQQLSRSATKLAGNTGTTTDVALRDPNAELLRRAQRAIFVPASDYDRDNVYTNNDIQAFLTGFAQGEFMADRSIDGMWNDQDVSIFLADFAQDSGL